MKITMTVQEMHVAIIKELNKLPQSVKNKVALAVVEDLKGDIYLIDENEVLGSNPSVTDAICDALELADIQTETIAPGKIYLDYIAPM